jgi:acyl dehydratase
LDFARAYDPNLFHLDSDVARSVGLDDIIASGFHTLSLSFRLFFDIHPWDAAILPSPGVDKVRFLKPVYPGDTVFVRATVLETIPSKSKSDRGIVRLSHETLNAASNASVLTAEALHRLRRRRACARDVVA